MLTNKPITIRRLARFHVAHNWFINATLFACWKSFAHYNHRHYSKIYHSVFLKKKHRKCHSHTHSPSFLNEKWIKIASTRRIPKPLKTNSTENAAQVLNNKNHRRWCWPTSMRAANDQNRIIYANLVHTKMWWIKTDSHDTEKLFFSAFFSFSSRAIFAR